MNIDEKIKFGDRVACLIGGILILVVIIQFGRVLFGDLFDADKGVMRKTTEAQNKIRNALLLTFNDFGKLEVREDYTVRAYISKKNYEQVSNHDRDKAIAKIGKIWCEDKSINIWYLPKVILRDIDTGENLGSYSCLSKK